jgi:hypothetical protein
MIDKNLKFVRNPTAGWLISLVVVAIVIKSLPYTPFVFNRLLESHLTKFVVFVVALYIETGDVSLSILISLALVFLLYFFGRFKEKFELIKPDTDSFPGCNNVTSKDLLDLFEGNYEKLATAMFQSGVPLNVALTDENAPEIATYLINHNIKVNDSCNL